MPKGEIQECLLSKGYFPKELPPVFTTTDFGIHSREIIEEWRSLGVFETSRKTIGRGVNKKNKRGSYEYKVVSSEPEIISKPKRGYERRLLHLTHPIPQALLSFELSENWKNVQRFLAKRTYSLDEIRVNSVFERSIKGINFRLHREKKKYIEGTSDWIVKTDISRFYPTIYTHSIPWAAYGKERVKSNIKLYSGSFADRVDVLVRSCNRNQTIGIPIGPETSRIIAEIISARIDYDFKGSSLNIPAENVDRLQDDWLIGSESLEKSEAILSKISSIYRAYGLDINGFKTSIEHIISSKSEGWISEIGSFLSHRSGDLHGSRLREFLNICLRLQSNNPFDPVINYALSVIEGISIRKSDVRDMESFVLKSAVIAPNSMDRICRMILDLQHSTRSVSLNRVGKRFLCLAERSLEKEHHYEAIWLLYTLRGLNWRFISKNIPDILASMPSASIVLILLDMKERGSYKGRLPISEWENLIDEESILSGWVWLLGYEGFRHGWLADKNRLMKGKFFNTMNKRGVAFYDKARNIGTVHSSVAARRAVINRQRNELAILFSNLRNIPPSEY